MGKLETIAGNIATLSQITMQNNADVADLKSSVVGSFARCNELSDQIVLMGNSIYQRHQQIEHD
eukprot:3418731-Pyramimonas_sp.AAC.1